MLYAQLENDVIINVVEADEAFATEQGLTLIDGADPMPGIGWSSTSSGWQPPPPDPAAAVLEGATVAITQVLDGRAEFEQQISADVGLWQGTVPGTPLTQEHLDALARMVLGFQTILSTMQAHMVLTGTIPPGVVG